MLSKAQDDLLSRMPHPQIFIINDINKDYFQIKLNQRF